MAEKVKVFLNSAGIRAYLKHPNTQAMLNERAQRIADRAGEGYEVQESHGRARARAIISTTDIPSRVRESRNGNLRKAIGD